MPYAPLETHFGSNTPGLFVCLELYSVYSLHILLQIKYSSALHVLLLLKSSG